jgi:sugar/nucleoside kinase (ribokinase family)
MEMGPKYVVIKKGEHGAMLISKDGIFLVPAYPIDSVVDPTGAGDSFAGGFMGSLATCSELNDAAMRKSLLYGSVIASFGVEKFSLDGLQTLTEEDIEGRFAELKSMMAC